jgi:transposase
MLSEEFINELIGLEEFEVIDAELEEEDGAVIFHVELKWDVGVCPDCGRVSGSVLEYEPRLSRDLSVLGRPAYLSFEQRRFRCRGCGDSFTERLASIESPGAHYTKRYEMWVVRQVRQSNVQAVAQQEGLSWDAVQGILERVAQREGLWEPPAVVRWLAIDEIALRKGHKQYVLVISAPEQGRVLAVLPERTQEALASWLCETWCEEQRRQVEVVTIDMWDGYFGAVVRCLPQAVIVIDRFHVEKNLLDAITKLRRQIQHQLAPEQKAELKGIRWLVVSNYDDLDDEQRQKLDQALDACPELALCHSVKEAFRDWYEDEDQELDQARRQLNQWTKLAASLGSRALDNFVGTVRRWEEWILNYFIERASNGFAEGMNNALKLLKRQAYGFRNFAHFRLRVLLLHAFS